MHFGYSPRISELTGAWSKRERQEHDRQVRSGQHRGKGWPFPCKIMSPCNVSLLFACTLRGSAPGHGNAFPECAYRDDAANVQALRQVEAQE